jgi:hypothetical protein
VYLFFILIGSDIRIDQNHNESGDNFDNQKLQNKFLTTVCKILRFFPGGELVGLLAIVKGEKVMHLFFMLDHDQVHSFIVHGFFLSVIGQIGENKVEESK